VLPPQSGDDGAQTRSQPQGQDGRPLPGGVGEGNERGRGIHDLTRTGLDRLRTVAILPPLPLCAGESIGICTAATPGRLPAAPRGAARGCGGMRGRRKTRRPGVARGALVGVWLLAAPGRPQTFNFGGVDSTKIDNNPNNTPASKLPIAQPQLQKTPGFSLAKYIPKI